MEGEHPLDEILTQARIMKAALLLAGHQGIASGETLPQKGPLPLARGWPLSCITDTRNSPQLGEFFLNTKPEKSSTSSSRDRLRL